MQVGDTIHINHHCGKAGVKQCRGTILEINNAIAKVSIWTGKEFINKPVMIRDLQKEK